MGRSMFTIVNTYLNSIYIINCRHSINFHQRYLIRYTFQIGILIIIEKSLAFSYEEPDFKINQKNSNPLNCLSFQINYFVARKKIFTGSMNFPAIGGKVLLRIRFHSQQPTNMVIFADTTKNK